MGKTFLSLFSGFDREELCQLYIYPSLPDTDACSAYYRVTDKDVLRSVMTFGRPGGVVAPERICSGNTLFENPADEGFYRSRKNKAPIRRLLRDTMWGLSGWYSPELKKWLDIQQPTCIFVAPGIAGFLYDIAMKIARERKIPIVTYICDDYYFNKPSGGFLADVQHRHLRRKTEQLLKRTSRLVVICQELAEDYRDHFSVETAVVLTGAAFPISTEPSVADAIDSITYFGNIRCGRNHSLAQIGRELDRMNRERNAGLKLRIFTAEKDEQILSVFDGVESVEFPGYVSGAEFERMIHNARLLLHTEGFAQEDVDRVRHSLSTKIADSLASGVPLLAYGPEEVASMGHLIRNQCALTAVTQEELPGMLEVAFADRQLLRQTAERGLSAARKYHKPGAASILLRQVLTEAEGNDVRKDQ